MYVLILPVSGGGFGRQLSIIQHLCESCIIPELILASSGGNVAAYVAAAANWKWPRIEIIARNMSSNLFVCPWSAVSAFSFVIGYFKGTMYNKGNGVEAFLNKYFNKDSITKYEIWTGTYNKKKQKACLFCNRSRDHSILDISCIDHDLTQSMEPVFNDGKIDCIANAGIASASIPATVPAQSIDGEDYIDGGIAGASPLTIMQEPILKYVREHQTSLHLIYVNSIDLSGTQTMQCNNVVDNFKQAANDLVRTQTVIDRLAAYELLRCHPGLMHKEEFICNYANIERIKLLQSTIQYSLLEIYPTNDKDLDIANFTGEDVITSIRQTYNSCKCRFWWLQPTDKEDNTMCIGDICNILTQCKYL